MELLLLKGPATPPAPALSLSRAMGLGANLVASLLAAKGDSGKLGTPALPVRCILVEELEAADSSGVWLLGLRCCCCSEVCGSTVSPANFFVFW